MAQIHAPNTTKNGLVLMYDSANVRSYPGTGSNWYDLSGGGNTGTIVGSPSYTSSNFGGFSTDAVDDNITTPYMNLTTARTVEVTYKMNATGTSWGPLFRNDWIERMFPSNIVIINSTGTYYTLSGPVDNTTIQVGCYSVDGTSVKAYRNGTLTDSQTMNAAMTTGSYQYNFGFQCGGSTCTYANVTIYGIKIYNRQLTDTEVNLNFNALRQRYGI